MNINGQTDGPLLPLNAVTVFKNDHRRGYVTADGQAWEYYNGRGTTLESSWHYWEHVSQCPRDWARPFREIWHEIERGEHDSSLGLRPVAVELDRDGDYAVAYPGGPDWGPWTTKVRRGPWTTKVRRG
jgi:hypothetical protein